MTSLKSILPISLILGLSACSILPFVPQVDETPKVDGNVAQKGTCRTITKHLTFARNPDHVPPRCNDANCLAGYGYVVVADAIVAGSIVLIGNTVHWLEYQGTCSDGYLAAAKQKFLDSLASQEPTDAEGAGNEP